ncbi:unnamed protein product [Rhizophagus irregularis]|nr:unnamed protein product [Rhizophagus irregularis]
MKEKYNFREFFYLCIPDNPKANKKAVCFSCIRKHTLPIAISKPKCFVSNKALLCCNHLKKCENFAHEYHESEREEILSRKVPEDEKKNKTQAIINESKMETDKSTTAAPSNSIIKQSTLSGYVSQSFSNKDIPYFENLVLLLMMVSNGLSFTFLEYKETQEVFRFIAPALKLSGRHTISNRILFKSANQLSISIVEQAKSNAIGITAAFDGWTNVKDPTLKQEHLFGFVLITSSGKTLIWGAKDISDQRSKTEDVKMLIKNLMNNAKLKQIKINYFVSDSAGEYAVAKCQLRVEYPSKVFLPCMAYQMNLVVRDIFKESLQYKQISKNAVRIVSYFHSFPYFTGLLRNEQTSCYGQTIALITPGETRWNSYYFCFRSILKTEAALKFEENIIDFWESAKGLAPEFSKLALHLFGICVNAALVECLWSNMGFLHSTRRNKLHHKKVLAMAQLRSDILCKRKRDNIEISERQYKQLHIAEPIQEYQSDEEDTNDNDDNINSEQWTKIIEDWIKMVNAEINIDNTEVIGEDIYEFEISGQSIHPADNPLVKWKLLDLFNETLEAPVNMF